MAPEQSDRVVLRPMVLGFPEDVHERVTSSTVNNRNDSEMTKCTIVRICGDISRSVDWSTPLIIVNLQYSDNRISFNLQSS